MNNQKNFYFLCVFILFFLFVFNWNYSSLCLNNTLCVNEKSDIYIPHITKIFLTISFLSYAIVRGILIPVKKNIKIKYLFPYRFIIITFFSFILDLVKSLTFLTLIFLKFFYLTKKKIITKFKISPTIPNVKILNFKDGFLLYNLFFFLILKIFSLEILLI